MLRATLARRSKMLPPSGGPNLHNPLPVPIEQLPWFSKLMLGRNNVLENQRKWQQDSHIPTYLRGNGKYYYRVWLGLYAVGTVMTGQVIYEMLQK